MDKTKIHYSDKKGDSTIKPISVSREKNMNPNSLNNLTPFKAGISGNPNGKPSNKKLKIALSKIGDVINPEPKEVNPAEEFNESMNPFPEPYTPCWDKRTKREKVLDTIWSKAIDGDLKVIEFLARLGCLD